MINRILIVRSIRKLLTLKPLALKLLMMVLPLFMVPVWAATWTQVEKQAKEQTVYFYGWGGHPQINDYIQWAAREIKRLNNVNLVHVKVGDISEAVTLILSEKSAERHSQGRVDLLWVNGENFAALKRAELLYGPFTDQLPNYSLVDKRLPVDIDFATPVDGLEAPWGVGQMVMMFDRAVTPRVPASASELLHYARKHPGRISYPQPPQFHGVTFLKQLLSELVEDAQVLQKPVDTIDFDKVTEPLWHYLDQLHKVGWYSGRRFPQSDQHMMQLLDDRELHMAISFNPAEAAAAVNRGSLVHSVSSHAFQQGALTNIHFLAIPYNSSAKEGAQVVINFLMSPQAQQRKADLAVWGDPPVLQSSLLDVSPEATARFDAIPEPHFSWHGALVDGWLKRYGYQ
ncbi:ABC transporter substrate-binding protein [Endozoicomonas gorgoniicola]|uniref:ABC transporter substrate-binding protein n=1 Tax=Endozoicomonas gorgoniicola TaxID=1234144 RepID=A0ABT3N2T5_9GAMM|nr:ABC transporter substrate-binding protein [Endozoicomonas gorgoniicola]MCW7555942.1 ABC transporter substrate-binding protein [Endozoicomonas gorgoniicola]